MAPPPTSRKFAGIAPRQLDDVHRRHRQSGAVDHAADVAIEPDVVERELRGFDFERVFLAQVAQIANVGVAKQRVVVEVHLRVEREQVAALGDDQRVDLEDRRIGGDERLVERSIILTPFFTESPVRPTAKARCCAWNGCRPTAGIDEDLVDLLRRLVGDFFDLDAALFADHQHDALRGAIEDESEVELAVDGEAFLDQQARRPSGRRGRSDR